MDDSYLPSKRTLNPFFSPGNYGSSSSSSSASSDKIKVKKQKLRSTFANTTPPSSSSIISATESKTAVTSTVESPTPTKIQATKLHRFFETRTSTSQPSVPKCSPPLSPSPQQLDQVKEPSPQPSSPTESQATTIMITKSMHNISVSDPDCIPTPRKASEWTTPSRSSSRPLSPIKSTPMEIDENDVNGGDIQTNNNKKRHLHLPWPDSMTFMGGHIKQSSSGGQKASHLQNDGNDSVLQYNRNESSCNLQQIIQDHGCAYLKSLGRKRLSKSLAVPASSNMNTMSPTMLSKLRVLSPSTSSSIQPQHASFFDQQGQLPYDIEETMDALYPSDDNGNGWNYPACEDLLNRYKHGEWKTTAGSSSTVDNNMNWCDKYRPKRVEYLLDNQSHHRYLRDWLERHKVAPSKSDASFFAPRKKVTQREMEQHYDDAYDLHDGDDDDFMLPGESGAGKKKKKPTKKRKKDLNLILLVGPHGSGKTSGVFTAAQETGYQVFEIHPGLRRSLKDVIRLVGDMTKNHLVRFQGIKSAFGQQQQRQLNGTPDDSGLADDDDDDDDDDDINSSRSSNNKNMETNKKPPTHNPNQLLTQFFTPKTSITKKTQEKPSSPPLSETDRPLVHSDMPTNQRQSSITTKSLTLSHGPKQSLILLEEVDVLYQTDKGFWNGVTDLARTSKRPIILTCNDTSVIPFDILQLQAIVHYESPLRQLLLPFLHLICLMEGYLVSTRQLVTLIEMVGPDIRQLLTTLEYQHYYNGTLNDQQQNHTPELHNSTLQAHINLLIHQTEIYTLQRSWYHLSDNIPGAQLAPLCIQLAQNDPTNEQSNLDIDVDDGDDDDDLLTLLQTWLDNRSLIDYGISMTEARISQVYGIDEHGGKDDQESGYMHFWKKQDDWDHYEMEANMESSLLELNQPQPGTGLVDIMSWAMICDQRDMQYEEDWSSVEHMLNCRSSMALGSIGILDIVYSKHIEDLRRTNSRRRRRRQRRVPF